MKQQLGKLEDQIDDKRATLKKLYQEGKSRGIRASGHVRRQTEADPTQPILSRVSEDQYAKLLDRLAQCDFDCLEALSHLEAAKSVPSTEPGPRSTRNLISLAAVRVQERRPGWSL